MGFFNYFLFNYYITHNVNILIMLDLLKEATVVGISLILFGYIGSYIASVILPDTKRGEYFNKYYVMELSLFLAGFIAHLVFEYTGINKWYCKNGVACK